MAKKYEVLNVLNYYNDLAIHTKRTQVTGVSAEIAASNIPGVWDNYKHDYTKEIFKQVFAICAYWKANKPQ